MDGLGTMTWEQFVVDVQSIVKISNDINDGWELIGDKIKTFVPCEYPIDDVPSSGEEDNDSWTKNSTPDDPFEAESSIDERPLITLHHVLWSMSYGVPVLYFNGWKSDFPGCNPVSVETAQRLMKNDHFGYSELSQAIHPVLGTPFLQFHPCKSQELLSNLSKSKNKVVSWLSAAGPSALNLKVSEDYYKLTITADADADDE